MLRHESEPMETRVFDLVHELGNIIGSILGNAEIAAQKVDKASMAAGCLEDILSASSRAREVLKQMSHLSKGSGVTKTGQAQLNGQDRR